MNHSFLRILSNNAEGRDFVIGDLHGQIQLLNIFKDFISFDPRVDRVISVGDLIDRGADSLACLQLLNEPWFHCVKGNHEQLMEDFLTGGPTGGWWFRNGGGWWLDLNDDNKQIVNDFIPKIQSLPWVINVPGQFAVVHAELPPGELSLDSEHEVKGMCLALADDGEIALWGRNLWGSLYAQFIDNRITSKFRRRLSLLSKCVYTKVDPKLFSGHTTLREPCEFEGRINIDTGAFRVGRDAWAGLTVAEPLTGKFWKINDGVHEVALRVL